MDYVRMCLCVYFYIISRGAASLADGPLPPPDGKRDPHDRTVKVLS